jgi:hypothetical protein
MAHTHTHTHDDQNLFYLDQLCTIGFCGTLGVVQILLYQFKVLPIMLAPKFHVPVLLSGIVLLLLAVIRAVALWVAVGKNRTAQLHSDCCHDHEHTHVHEHEPGLVAAQPAAAHEHAHPHVHGAMAEEHVHAHVHGHVHDHNHGDAEDHECCGHEHTHTHEDCGHDHGWSPWRYIVLLLPILLFLLGLPWPADANLVKEKELPAGVMFGEFKELRDAANLPQTRQFWDGKLVRVRGQYSPGRDQKTVKLFRLQRTCCAADAYPVFMPVKSTEPLDFSFASGQWVYVTGTVSFQKHPHREEYETVIDIKKSADLEPASPPAVVFLD